MAKSIYFGISDKARKVKSAYFGVGGKARKIKKAYIGDANGKARLFFGYGAPVYHGVVTNLTSNVYGSISASTGTHAIIAGGWSGSSGVKTVNAYDANLTKTTPTSLTYAGYPAGVSVGGYALFGPYGGYTTVDVYDSSLTKSTKSVSTKRSESATASIGNYALIMGGFIGASQYPSVVVDAFDTSLTKVSADNLSINRYSASGASNGKYAFIAAGCTFDESNNASWPKTIETYDTSLTHSTATDTFYSVQTSVMSASMSKYAIFGGGITASTDTSTVYAYDTSLTRKSSSLAVSAYSGQYSATSLVDEYALFAGNYSTPTVTIFDSSFVRTANISLSVARQRNAAANVGEYAIFAGGQKSITNPCTDVEAITVS